MKAQAEISKLRGTVKPSFWIDQESVKGMNDKLLSAYDKHKTKNINLTTRKKTDSISDQTLIKVTNLSLGYGKTPLFENINFTIRSGERIRLHGRNGAGKSTIVKAIMSQVDGSPSAANYLKGSIETRPAIKIGLYEQEIDTSYLGMTLYEAIEKILRDKNLPISVQKIKQLMSDYLFNPMADGKTLVDNLSGGQKARVQLIAMLANDPQMLILDEPTNHLDLPSIEELENAMQNYYGAIIYISHDSFFANKIGGEEIKMDQSL